MRVIEIRLDSGLLLIGSPGAFDRTMLSAADHLAAPAVIRVLERNSAAMGRLRAELRAIYPAVPAHALSDRDIVGRLRDELAAGRLAARLLRMSGQGTPSIQLADKTRGIVHVPLADRTILIAPPGGLPPEFAGAAGLRSRQAPSLAGLPALSQQMGMLERQACRLPGVPAMLRGQNLTQFLDTRIAQGQLEWVVLDDRLATARAAQRQDAPRGIEELDQGEKVAEAISRSRNYLGGAVLAAVEEMVRPENLAIMAAVILGVALAQLNPVSAAVVDGTLVILAWTFAGLAGIRAIGTLVNATVTAIDADGEEEIDAAAKLYAEAFVGLGAAVLQALMARALSKKGGKTGDDFKARLNEGTGEGKGGSGAKPQQSGSSSQSAGKPAKPAPSKQKPVKFGEKGKYTEPGAEPATAETLKKMADAKAREANGPLKQDGWPEIPADQAATFMENPTAIELKPGQKIYRVIDKDSNPNGSFWTTADPRAMSEADWRSGAAVKGEWNGDGAFVEHVVGPEGMKVWSGEAAPQMSSDGVNVLKGGGNQLWIPRGNTDAGGPISTGWTQ